MFFTLTASIVNKKEHVFYCMSGWTARYCKSDWSSLHIKYSLRQNIREPILSYFLFLSKKYPGSEGGVKKIVMCTVVCVRAIKVSGEVKMLLQVFFT